MVRGGVGAAACAFNVAQPGDGGVDALGDNMPVADLIGIDAVGHQLFRQIGQPRHLRQPQPQIIILGMGKSGPITTHRVDNLAFENHRIVQHEMAGFEIGQHILMGKRAGNVGQAKRGAIGANAQAIRADDAVIGVLRQKRHLPLEPVGQADVIGIHAGDQRRAALADQLVEAGNQPPVFPENEADAGVGLCMGGDDRP